MRIAFNPSTVAALTSPPNNKDITFDLRGQNIFARGVKFCGTDTNTWRDIKINNVSIGSHTLDLRNGSNTTLTNTNGVVTINSTWRPVVDNLTSNSTTSSLSANQGRVLKALIDSKSDSGHNHDGRYVRYYAVTTLDCNNLAVGLTAASVNATNAGAAYHSAYLYILDVGTPFQIQIPDSNVPYIYKRYYSSGKWSGWFKLNAGYADSAGSVAWANITGKPSSYTPSAHTHAWNSLTHSSTTANQAILTNGSANGWKLYTLNISAWDNAANNAHSHANKSVLDGITSGLINNWNTAYNFVSNITGTDTDKVINKWDEIVNFLAGITEDNKLNTLLNSKLSVYELADKTNVGTIKNNGIYYSTTDASSGTLTNSPFNTGFALINMTSLDDGGNELRRSRLAFNAFGEIKVSDDRSQLNTAETWYNVLTSKNSGISGSTIKLNGTSITVYSSGTTDGRYVKKSGDTMTGVLTIDTTNFGALTIKRNDDANGASIQFRGKSSVYGYIGLNNSTKDKQFLRWSSDTSRVYTILDTSSTYIANGKGIINGTTITQVDNADTVDGEHASNFSYTHQSSFDFNTIKNGRIVTFDHSNTAYGWINGFASTHDNYLTSVIFNSHRTSNWYVGYIEGNTSTGKTNGLQAVHKLAFTDQIPTSLKNPHALTISLNGTSQGPYDGSAAKSINITPGSIGAATSGHNHDDRYLRLTGGWMSGDINFGGDNKIHWGRNTDSASISFKNDGDEDANSYMSFVTSDNGNEYFRWSHSSSSTNTEWMALRSDGLRVRGTKVSLEGHTHDDRYYTKAESNAKYITDITTSVNKLTFTRNGSNIIRDITVNVVHSQGYLTNIPNKDATTKASPGLFIYNSYGQTIGTNSYSSVLSINTGGTIQIAGNWGDDTSRNLYWRSQSNRAVSSYPWKSWRTILDSENYSFTLDSRYYTESEVNSLLDAKLNRQNLSYGNWNPRGWNLAADYYYNGGDLSISETGGQIHVSVDGKFWQNEGQYRVLDTSDIAGIRGSVTLYQYLSSTNNNWFPLVWGGSDHKNTNNSTGSLYKSHDKLSWQTSSQTLYATNIQTNNIKNLSIGGGIYWNPYVESANDGSDAASITLVRSGVAGGTTLVLSQMNDTNDTIQFQTNGAARLYHNNYPILTTQNTYVSNNKGYINGTEITQVNNAGTLDGAHLIRYGNGTGIKQVYYFHTQGNNTSYIKLGTLNTVAVTGAGSSKVMFTVKGGINFGGTNESVYEVAASTRESIQVTSTLVRGNRELKFGYVSTSSNVEIWMAYDGTFRGVTEVEVSSSVSFTLAMTETTTKPSGFVEGSYRILASTADNVASATNAYHLRINSANTWSTWYWAGQSGQPIWLWGSNDGTNMYVWSPSNFRVAYAASAGNADTVDGLHGTDGRTFTGNINWSDNWNDAWSDGTNKHPWYGFDHRYPNTGAYSTTLSDYFGMTIKTYNTLLLDCGTLLLNSRNNVGIGTTSPTQKLDVTGNIRATGQIIREGHSTIWVYGRNVALLRETSAVGYHTLWSLKTTNGSWDFGEYNAGSDWDNIPVLSYITDSNYNSGNNATTYQIKFPLASGTVALTSNIPNPTNYYWANVKISASSSTTTSPTVHTLTATRVCAGHNPGIDNSISCSNWFRSSGNTGWYNTTYQGGWYMSDTSWIRAHNGVGIYTSGQIYSSSSIRMGNILLENTDEINNSANGNIYLNYRHSGNVNLCQGGGNVGIGVVSPSYKLHVNGQIMASGFHHASHNDDSYVLLAGGGTSHIKHGSTYWSTAIQFGNYVWLMLQIGEASNGISVVPTNISNPTKDIYVMNAQLGNYDNSRHGRYRVAPNGVLYYVDGVAGMQIYTTICYVVNS